MKYIIEVLIYAAIGAVTVLFGSSRREEKKVDSNKTVMRQPASLRYSMYFLGAMFMAIFCYLIVSAVRDGVLEEEPWTLAGPFAGFLVGVFCVLCGYFLYARHVFFDDEELLVGRPFKGLVCVKWQEISRMDMKNGYIVLYGPDGKKLVKAQSGMDNYDMFALEAKRACSGKQGPKQREWTDSERVMRRRAGSVALFILAVCVFGLFALFAAVAEYSFVQIFAEGKFGFQILFYLAVLILFFSIRMWFEKIRYTKEEITFSKLFSKKTFSWDKLQKIRRNQPEGNMQKLYLTWDGKEYAVSPAKYAKYFGEFEDFVIDIALGRNIPTQNL